MSFDGMVQLYDGSLGLLRLDEVWLVVGVGSSVMLATVGSLGKHCLQFLDFLPQLSEVFLLVLGVLLSDGATICGAAVVGVIQALFLSLGINSEQANHSEQSKEQAHVDSDPANNE